MVSERTSVVAAGRTAASSRTRLWLYGLLPLLLLALFVVFFLRFGPLGVFRAAFPPVEELTITRVALRPGHFDVYVTNGGPSPVTIAQVLVDDAYWNFTIHPAPTIPRLGRATITIPYPWVEGETHGITLLSSSGITFVHTVEVAAESPQPTAQFLLTFTLLGVYVGIIPVFLGVDALAEALESAGHVPAAFQGTALVAVGFLASSLALIAAGRLARGRVSSSRLLVAYLIAIGIGLHNLGEGLAIGAAYNLGKLALGTFLVIGFMLHNTTEGLGIVAPVAREGAALRDLVGLGLVAGAPTIAGAWLGGFTYSSVLATLFLALGAGAIFQVVYEVLKLMIADAAQEVATLINVLGFALGLLIMYLTGLFVAV